MPSGGALAGFLPTIVMPSPRKIPRIISQVNGAFSVHFTACCGCLGRVPAHLWIARYVVCVLYTSNFECLNILDSVAKHRFQKK